jgi:hypothetical protein
MELFLRRLNYEQQKNHTNGNCAVACMQRNVAGANQAGGAA